MRQVCDTSNVRPILTIISPKELPPGWEKDADAFAAISARLDALPATPLATQGWAWVRARDVHEASKEGRAHGLACAKYGLTRWYANAEAEWAGVERFPRTPAPYAALRAYALAWRIYAPPECELAYNGFSWNRTSDGRRLHDRVLMGAFDVWSPMCYAAVERTAVDKIRKYPDLRPCPMFGVGRIDKNNQVWGRWEETRAVLDATGVDEFAWFFGNGARAQFYEGHRDHPPLVRIARGLASNEWECA